MRHGAASVAFTPKGQAPLHLAVEKGHVGATTALLVAGADVNLCTKGGVHALCLAVYAERTDVLNVLIQHGADVKRRDSQGQTALNVAACGNEDDAVDALVAAGADLEEEDDEGLTPILLSGSEFVFSALLKHGANAAKRDADGRGVIHRAAHGGCWDIMQELLASGVDANLRDSAGKTTLHLTNCDSPSVVAGLLEHGADVDARDLVGFTALNRMARSFNDGGSVPSIKALVSGGAAIETRDRKAWTPLLVASNQGNLPAMRALLRSGADLHAKDDRGRSPLHLVVGLGGFGFADVAKSVDLLLRWGADENATVEIPSNGYSRDGYSSDGHMSNGPSTRETAAGLWEETVRTGGVSAAEAAPVGKLLADAQKDRTWRRRGWLMLVRAFPDSVRLKAESSTTAIATGMQRVRARGVAAAAWDGAQAGTASPGARSVVRRLSGVVAGVVTFEEEGVFRNIVEFL